MLAIVLSSPVMVIGNLFMAVWYAKREGFDGWSKFHSMVGAVWFLAMVINIGRMIWSAS